MNRLIKCRICNGSLEEKLNLGNPYISDFLLENEEGIRAPLVLGKCISCDLIQLMHEVNIDKLYKEHYWYRSSLNKSMLNDLENIVRDIESRIKLSYGDIVCDIGCNDGSLFTFYRNEDLKFVGFDPAPNIKEKVMENGCNYFFNTYFGNEKYDKSFKAKVITSIAMFYDLPDPNLFVEGIAQSLCKDGIWVIQFTDLMSMLKVNAIDNICQEHLEYYSLLDVQKLVEKFGLEVFDVSFNKVNGGSIRIFVGHEGKHRVHRRVRQAEIDEFYGLKHTSIEDLGKNIIDIRYNILEYISSIEGDVYGMAASTKGNTLLQVLGLNNSDIKAIGEINKDKFGLVTAGTWIPIVSEKEVLDKNPELIIVLAWHFKKTFSKVLDKYIQNGGKVLYPLPLPYVISKDMIKALNG
jgi:hypothetical protein